MLTLPVCVSPSLATGDNGVSLHNYRQANGALVNMKLGEQLCPEILILVMILTTSSILLSKRRPMSLKC